MKKLNFARSLFNIYFQISETGVGRRVIFPLHTDHLGNDIFCLFLFFRMRYFSKLEYNWYFMLSLLRGPIHNFGRKLQFFCWKSILRYVGNVSQNIRGQRVLEPPWWGAQKRRWEGVIGINPDFINFGKNYYFVLFFVLKKYSQVCERCVHNRIHPNMRPKGDKV